MLAVAGIRHFRRPIWRALVVEPIDWGSERGGSLDVAHRKAASVRAAALLEPWRADPGQS
jgi:hypothetical protein